MLLRFAIENFQSCRSCARNNISLAVPIDSCGLMSLVRLLGTTSDLCGFRSIFGVVALVTNNFWRDRLCFRIRVVHFVALSGHREIK